MSPLTTSLGFPVAHRIIIYPRDGAAYPTEFCDRLYRMLDIALVKLLRKLLKNSRARETFFYHRFLFVCLFVVVVVYYLSVCCRFKRGSALNICACFGLLN